MVCICWYRILLKFFLTSPTFLGFYVSFLHPKRGTWGWDASNTIISRGTRCPGQQEKQHNPFLFREVKEKKNLPIPRGLVALLVKSALSRKTFSNCSKIPKGFSSTESARRGFGCMRAQNIPIHKGIQGWQNFLMPALWLWLYKPGRETPKGQHVLRMIHTCGQ